MIVQLASYTMEEIDGAVDEVVFFVNGRKVQKNLSL